MKHFGSLSIPIARLAVTLPVRAHHSSAEFYFMHASMEIEGMLLEVAWQNPHVQLTFKSADGNGHVVVWDIETNSVSSLSRSDVKRDDFKVGETVKTFGAPSRLSANRFFAKNVVRANGKTLMLFSKPSGLQTASTDNGADATIFHVWVLEVGFQNVVRLWKKDYPLTKAARKTLNAWNPVTDTVTHGCKPKGMPTIMEQPIRWISSTRAT
jgi:hypothetical protein